MEVLCADIGGTNTRLCAWSASAGLYAEHTFRSEEFGDVAAPIRRWLDETGVQPDRACLGIAGPVIGGRCRTTNLPWVVEADGLRDAFGFPFRLVNDFHAAARGIGGLGVRGRVKIAGGEPVAGSPVVVMGPGTGLGEAIVAGDTVLAGEGGHSDFGPANARELRFAAWRIAQVGRVDWEDVLSGTGLVSLARFWFEDSGRVIPRELQAPDAPAWVVAECPEVVAWFCELLGAEAGNLAMKVLPLGGVYLAGGIAPRILPQLNEGGFYQRFMAKGRSSHAISTVPIWVVTHSGLGLLGAAREAELWARAEAEGKTG